MWVELRRGEKEIDDRSGLCESRGCESRRDGEAICGGAGGCNEEKGFDDGGGGGGFSARIGLGLQCYNIGQIMGRGFGIY